MKNTSSWLMTGDACLFIACLMAPFVQASDRPTDEQLAFFEQRIRPVLIEHCYECHSGQAAKLQGGLRLDLREGILRGGDSGPARRARAARREPAD